MFSKPRSLVDRVADAYLLLHRENYLDEETDVKIVMRNLAASVTPQERKELLESPDWREVILGIYCVIAIQDVASRDRLGTMLLRGKQTMLKRPLCLALTILGGEESAGYVSDFLNMPYEEDAFTEYAAALAAIEKLDPEEHARLEGPLVTRLAKEEYYEPGDFRKSRERFGAALAYWQAG
jgi:Family of unknown function (DUF6000)